MAINFAASLLIVLLWAFPKFWYTAKDESQSVGWFQEKTDLPGWDYFEIPVAESAERVLVADTLFSGEFVNTTNFLKVTAFSARRLSEDMNEIGLFVHTPDRCWTESGWQISPSQPETVTISINDRDILFERRIFSFQGVQHLVYFTGLIDGQTLPYRLDHNLSVAMRFQLNHEQDKSTAGATARSSDSRFWNRIWESFTSRRRITGPKQFLRISTEISGQSDNEDTILRNFIASWLT